MQNKIHPLSIGVWCILLVEICIIILFGLFATYDDDAQAPAKGDSPPPSSELNSSSIITELNAVRKTTQFMDIHVMIFIGFGFLMTFMKRYSFGGLAFNFLLAALVLQWDLIINGLFHLNNDSKIPIGLESLIQGDVAAAAVLISMGALLGRTTFMQLLVMGLIEIVLYCANWYLAEQVWQVSDVGGSIFVHTFGAYFGLAVSWALHRRKPPSDDEEGFVSSYTSDVFAMIGSLFLWIFWPSFNAADAVADGQQRAIINTYLSLASCCVVSFLLSYIVSGERKFDMVHVQNSTLAGGVAVGTVADMMLEPWGALLIGAAAGLLSVMGYAYLTPGLARHGLPDTCGVHNLHGMPGVLGGLLGVLLASLASTDLYGSSLIIHYPAMGEGRKAGDQAAYQLYALLATLLIAVIGGLFTEFMDIHVMIFIGFGFLMTFMKRYSFGGLAFNFLLAALVLQWDLIINGLFHLNNDSKIPIGLESLIQGDVAAAAVLISMGALLGRTTFMQLLVMGLIEIVLYCANWYLAEQVWQVSDVGGSIFVHTFGAYFGLAVSWALHRRNPPSDDEEGFVSSYTSDVFAMIGSLFLWIFWPSFNAADAVADGQQRAIINTYLSLASCCVVSFLLSYIVSGERKFDMVHVQNSTLAGGVAVGTVADMMLEPWGALLIGAAAGLLSVMGYAYLTPGLARHGLPDTCGVHNLHGMPGVLGGLLGVLLASLASTDLYGSSLIIHYPAMGEGRKAGDQAAYQLYALLATLLIAVIGGLFTGFLLSLPPLSQNKGEDEDSKKHLDDNYWIIHKTI